MYLLCCEFRRNEACLRMMSLIASLLLLLTAVAANSTVNLHQHIIIFRNANDNGLKKVTIYFFFVQSQSSAFWFCMFYIICHKQFRMMDNVKLRWKSISNFPSEVTLIFPFRGSRWPEFDGSVICEGSWEEEICRAGANPAGLSMIHRLKKTSWSTKSDQPTQLLHWVQTKVSVDKSRSIWESINLAVAD